MRRNRFEIIAKILEVCKDGATKAEIIRRANINWKIASECIDFLIKKECLEFDERSYMLTKKGEDLARRLKDLKI